MALAAARQADASRRDGVDSAFVFLFSYQEESSAKESGENGSFLVKKRPRTIELGHWPVREGICIFLERFMARNVNFIFD